MSKRGLVIWPWVLHFVPCCSSRNRRPKRRMYINMDNNSRVDSIDISRHTPTTSSPSPSCEMCRNYELKLQIIQLNEDDLKRQVHTYDLMIQNLKEELKKEKANRSELEEKFTEEAKATELKLQECSKKLDESNRSVTQLRNQFEQLVSDTSEQIGQFSSHKERLCETVDRLTRENQVLLGRHIAKARDIQSEAIDLPTNMDDIHFYLLKLREDFISAVVAKESLEEYVNKDRHLLSNDIQNKEYVIQELRQEIDRLNSQLRKISSENDHRKHELKSQEEILEQCQERIAELMLQKEEVVSEMKWRLQEVTREKSDCESELSTLRSKLSSLQIELDNSEAVQRDFVKLSQSLQVSVVTSNLK